MGQGRVELPTSRLSGVRSNHLSYWPGVGTGDRSRPLETESYARLREALTTSRFHSQAAFAARASTEADVGNSLERR